MRVVRKVQKSDKRIENGLVWINVMQVSESKPKESNYYIFWKYTLNSVDYQ